MPVEFVAKEYQKGELFNVSDINIFSETLADCVKEANSNRDSLEEVKLQAESDKSVLEGQIKASEGTYSTYKEELETLKTKVKNFTKIDKVYPAILKDNTAESPKTDLIEDYSATVTKIDPTTIKVFIQGKNLRKHKDARMKDGYWIGFAVVPADEKVKKVKLSVDDAEFTDFMELEPNVHDLEKGIAIYFDFNRRRLTKSAKINLVWGDDSGNQIGDEFTYNLDMTTINTILT